MAQTHTVAETDVHKRLMTGYDLSHTRQRRQVVGITVIAVYHKHDVPTGIYKHGLFHRLAHMSHAIDDDNEHIVRRRRE